MMLFCFGGIALVAFSKDESEEESDAKLSSYEAGIAICGALSVVFAVSAVTTRRLKNCHFSIVQFYLVLTTLVTSAVWILILRVDNDVFDFVGKLPWIELVAASFCHWI